MLVTQELSHRFSLTGCSGKIYSTQSIELYHSQSVLARGRIYFTQNQGMRFRPFKKERNDIMASIIKRGNSYRVTVSNGRRSDGSQILETDTYTPAPGMTKRQIEKALNEFVVDFERDVKEGQTAKGRRMTLKQLSEKFLADTMPTGDPAVDTLAQTTWSDYKKRLEIRIIPELGHERIISISAKTLKNYSEKLRKDGVRKDGKPGKLAEGSIKKDCAIVSTLLSYAVGEELLPLNKIIYAGRQSRGKKAPKEYKVEYFTIEQAQRFLWALDNPIHIKYGTRHRTDKQGNLYDIQEYKTVWNLSLKWKAYFYLSLFVGDRRGENVSFLWTDINFQTGEVNIDKSTSYVDKKIIHKDTKTHQSRSAYIPQVVINVLRQWKTEQKRQCMIQGDRWSGYRTDKDYDKNYVFTQENGKQMHPSSPYHEFKRILRLYNENVATSEDQKFPDTAKPHQLRHTAASILIANNMDPRSVASILGHADPTTTLNIYSYFFRSKNIEAANVMENTLLKTQKI